MEVINVKKGKRQIPKTEESEMTNQPKIEV